jgi:hypothetical protein
MKTVGAFDVFKRMVDVDDKALELAPLNNIIHLKAVNAGTQVTIGVGRNILNDILDGRLVGGLILCNKEQFEKVKKEGELPDIYLPGDHREPVVRAKGSKRKKKEAAKTPNMESEVSPVNVQQVLWEEKP